MKFEFPHPLAILLIFIALASVLTHIIPAGQYDRVTDETTGREVVVANSYQEIEKNPVGIFETILKVPEGLIFGADIVVLILIIGGAFVVVDKTGAFTDGINALVTKFEHTQDRVIIIVGITFATVGLLNNTFEEIIAMVPFLIVMGKRIGYTKTGVLAISAGSAIIGAAFSPMNPFAVLLAQKIAEVQPFSGTLFRIIVFVIVLSFWIYWVIKKGKSDEKMEIEIPEKDFKLPLRSVFILILVAVTFAAMVGRIIDSIVYGLFNPLKDLPLAVSAVGMTVSQALLHIPVASNSGQAVLTMPLLTPLSDLIGMSRQVMILCYQYGAAMMDMISPTNGALLAMITAAGVSFKEWFSFCIKPFLIIMGMSLVAIFVAIFIGL